jgi:hypothetical protein
LALQARRGFGALQRELDGLLVAACAEDVAQEPLVDLGREVGKELFGRPCRLTLAIWIIRQNKPRFYQSEPPREVILQGDAAKELGHFVRLGMLEEERPDESRRVYYVRTDSPLWKIFEAAADVLEEP